MTEDQARLGRARVARETCRQIAARQRRELAATENKINEWTAVIERLETAIAARESARA